MVGEKEKQELPGDMKLLLSYVKNFYTMAGLSARVYEGGKLIKRFQASHLSTMVDGFFEEMLCNIIAQSKENAINALTNGSLLVYGISRNSEKNVCVILGPIRTNIVTEAQLSTLKEDWKVSEEVLDDIYRFLSMLPIMNIERFSGFFEMLNIYLTGEVPKQSKLKSAKSNDTLRLVAGNVLDYKERVYYNEIIPENYSESERRVLFYVKNGMVEQIESILKNSPLKYANGSAISETLRKAKNELILGIGLSSRAAISAGVEPMVCLRLADIFAEKAELSRNVSELIELRFNMLLFFAKEVKSLQMSQTSNPVVNRIIAYINENVEKKITCDEIAEKLNINRTYVSTCFKKEVGMGLIDYVNQQKITRAKYLLQFTNKPLKEITYYLSFSSQAYFSKIFKDVVGMTPLEYKERIRE